MDDQEKEMLIEQIQSEIAYCVTCQPYDEGDVVWIYGDENYLEDLFEAYDVPEELRGELARNLECPNCGRQFDRNDTYGSKTKIERRIEEKWNKWKANYEHDLNKFSEFITTYPYLGAYHPMGKKIIDVIGKFPSTDIQNSSWYRARSIRSGDLILPDDMKAPKQNEHLINEGRFNHYGQSHFYLANSDFGAAKEILAFSNEKFVWLQIIQILSARSILDVRIRSSEPDPDIQILAMGIIYYSNVLISSVKRNQNWKPEYFIPRFIGDAAKHKGFKGIIYSSPHHHGDNLVIFNSRRVKYSLVNEPYIYQLHETETVFDLMVESEKKPE